MSEYRGSSIFITLVTIILFIQSNVFGTNYNNYFVITLLVITLLSQYIFFQKNDVAIETIYGQNPSSSRGSAIIFNISFVFILLLMFTAFVSYITVINKKSMYEFNPILHNIAMILLALVSCIPPTCIYIMVKQ